MAIFLDSNYSIYAIVVRSQVDYDKIVFCGLQPPQKHHRRWKWTFLEWVKFLKIKDAQVKFMPTESPLNLRGEKPPFYISFGSLNNVIFLKIWL
jgi:hypothetical protein